jgi:hypothetical protein
MEMNSLQVLRAQIMVWKAFYLGCKPTFPDVDDLDPPSGGFASLMVSVAEGSWTGLIRWKSREK